MNNSQDLPSAESSTIASGRSPARATLYSIAIAAALLSTTILPAEYGVDPTGAGRVLGLTSMGERKMAAAKDREVLESDIFRQF